MADVAEEVLYGPDPYIAGLDLKFVHALGPEFSFSHVMANVLFNSEDIHRRKSTTIDLDPNVEVMRQVIRRRHVGTFALLAVENSTTSAVPEVADGLATGDFAVFGEATLKVDLCLAAPPIPANYSGRRKIETVYSHPKALGQAIGFLDARNYDREPRDSTSEAAVFVVNSKDPSKAAICAETAAKKYGLEVLSRKVQDQKDNWTRFLLCGSYAAYRTSIEEGVPELRRMRGDQQWKIAALLKPNISSKQNGYYHAITPLVERHIAVDDPGRVNRSEGRGDRTYFVELTGEARALYNAVRSRELAHGADIEILGYFPVGHRYSDSQPDELND